MRNQIVDRSTRGEVQVSDNRKPSKKISPETNAALSEVPTYPGDTRKLSSPQNDDTDNFSCSENGKL